MFCLGGLVAGGGERGMHACVSGQQDAGNPRNTIGWDGDRYWVHYKCKQTVREQYDGNAVARLSKPLGMSDLRQSITALTLNMPHALRATQGQSVLCEQIKL